MHIVWKRVITCSSCSCFSLTAFFFSIFFANFSSLSCVLNITILGSREYAISTADLMRVISSFFSFALAALFCLSIHLRSSRLERKDGKVSFFTSYNQHSFLDFRVRTIVLSPSLLRPSRNILSKSRIRTKMNRNDPPYLLAC